MLGDPPQGVAALLEESLVVYKGVTDADGNVGSTTLKCSDIGSASTYPDFDGNQIIITSGSYKGQARDIDGSTNGDVAGTITSAKAFGGQIVSGTSFIITGIRAASAEIDDLQATVDIIFNIVNAILTLTETGGTITTDGALQTLYINNAPAGVFQPRKLLMDFSNHAIGDIMIIRTYYRLNAAGALIKQDEETIVGVQDPATITIDLEDNRFGYEITIHKTVGANLTYDYELIYKI